MCNRFKKINMAIILYVSLLGATARADQREIRCVSANLVATIYVDCEVTDNDRGTIYAQKNRKVLMCDGTVKDLNTRSMSFVYSDTASRLEAQKAVALYCAN